MDAKLPLVSVIIPTYNCANYIERAINSVLEQTYLNTEIIVVNDGSTDDTEKILENYKNRIIIINQKNSGVAKARNVGISTAKGNYIATLDADDRWLPNRLEKMVDILENSKIDILISNFYYVDEDGVRLGNNNAFREDYVIPKPHEQYNKLLYTATAFGLMIIKKEKMEEYDELLKGEAEDYDLWLRLLKKGLKWGFVPTALAEVTYRQGSLSKRYSKYRKIALKRIFYKHSDKIGKFKCFKLYRYHLGGYRWDMIIVSIKEKNIKKVIKYSIIMMKSPLFIPIIVKRVFGFIYRKSVGH